ncbi:hypothetical protein B5S29_g1340 [[Candida] boidinii]|uniref:Unnamed protein product n=1 Tax=Candida boidinii TaxID=5477 RepID=A0ACB5TT14_CANBO|nr:hypothetical protein B5S29_g1340 [[Candida] boidinii]GME94770.1 unnamed protein product [[Candida] boidinii]
MVLSLIKLVGSSSLIKASTNAGLRVSYFSTFTNRLQQQQISTQQQSIDDSIIPQIRNTVKPLNSRKTYLMDIYKYFNENNQIILFTHHNNLLSSDNEKIRKQLHAAGADFRKIKTTIFKHYLRASNHPDPASKAALRQVKKKKIRHPLEPLLKGPTAAILIKDLNPKVVKDVLQVLKTTNEKLFLVGARVGSDVLDAAKIDEFKELPTLEESRAQLVGILTMLSGAGLVRTLESTANVLHLTLDTHRQEIEKKENGEGEGESESN